MSCASSCNHSYYLTCNCWYTGISLIPLCTVKQGICVSIIFEFSSLIKFSENIFLCFLQLVQGQSIEQKYLRVQLFQLAKNSQKHRSWMTAKISYASPYIRYLVYIIVRAVSHIYNCTYSISYTSLYMWYMTYIMYMRCIVVHTVSHVHHCTYGI